MKDQLDFIDKLFDTLKETTDDNTKTLQKLVEQQISLVGTVEKWPIPEIKQDIKDHVVSAFNERKGISEKIDELSVKVKIMIGVVVAVVALTGIVYYVARFHFDATDNQKAVTTIEERIKQEQEHEHMELIKAVREEIKKFHPEADKQEKVR